MPFKDRIPESIKRRLRPIYMKFKKRGNIPKYVFVEHKTKEELYEYWKKPWNGGNLPKNYFEGIEKSKFLLKFIKKYGTKESKIFEIGCNVGRNLNFLYNSNFKNLETVEISEDAVKLLKETFPEMANEIKIYNISIEDVINDFSNENFDIVFTMAVLEHIHDDSSWIFEEIVRITKKYLITIEDEKCLSWRHFPRNYKKIFEELGLKQIKEKNCIGIPNLGRTFYARVFKK